MGLQLELQLVTVVVAAAGLRQALVAPGPVHDQVSDEMVSVEDQQVITGGEYQDDAAGQFERARNKCVQSDVDDGLAGARDGIKPLLADAARGGDEPFLVEQVLPAEVGERRV